MQAAPPVLIDIVLVGGGHAHVEVLRRFAMRPLTGARLTLVSPAPTTPYSGMLPGLIAGHYDENEAHIDLGPLARAAGARLILARAVGLDPDRATLWLEGRPPIRFDRLSLDVGSTPGYGAVPGAAENSIPVKPVPTFLRRLDGIVGKTAGRNRPLRIATVGAGAAGVEVTLALAHRLRGRGASLALIDGAPHILPTHAATVRRRLAASLRRAGVNCHLGSPVERVDPSVVTLAGGDRIDADAIVWATGAAAPGWLAETGLALDGNGFIAVDAMLRSTSHPDVFAAGDCASMTGQPRPKSGVFAVRQGPPLAENLRRSARGLPLARHVPQTRFLSLISTGDRQAVASRGGLSLAGASMWRLKDWIDRRFMRRYADLPAMPAAGHPPRDSVPGAAEMARTLAMRCAGCGAKLPAGPLARALARLPGTAVDLSAPDDAAVLAPPPGKALLQSIDWFPAPLDDPYVFGRIAAIHCLGDIHAMNARPWTALALATVPPGRDDSVEDDLFQMLSGACAELGSAGAVLVGGHSTEAPQLGLGLMVNGLADPTAILRKGGATPGDAIILTKPLGTGMLLAAEMRGKARGPWIATAVETMLRSSANAAAALHDHGATAMTDVTGFGLGGHLGEMQSASGVDAVLDTEEIPVLPGVRETIAARIESSLAPANTERILNRLDGVAAPQTVAFLADPQTAGGLLAAVPNDRAAACITALRAGGDRQAAVIGGFEAMRGSAPRLRLRQTADW